MSSENIIKRFHNKEFIKLKVSPVKQKGKIFYVGILTANNFLKLFTVEPAEYDLNEQLALADKFPDDQEYFEQLINKKRNQIDTKEFQRKENRERVNKISQFLNEEEYPLFPNTIITTCVLYKNSPNFNTPIGGLLEDQIHEMYESTFALLEEKGKINYLYIPNKKNSLLVIDGQHRLKGLQKSNNNVIDNYELLVSFILEYDRSVIANLFYTINYTQKSVNKSLLYHLMGEFSNELNEITFMHETVKLLNVAEISPFRKRIKILGYVPQELTQDEKEKVTLSQAFLVDYLSPTISSQSKNSIHQPIFLYYFKRGKDQIEIIRFIIKFFSAIKISSIRGME